MGKISKNDVLKLAALSRIRISDDQARRFAVELQAILNYVDVLAKVDVAGWEPTYQVTGLVTVTRPDEIQNQGPYGASTEALLSNAPAVHDHQFKVKRVLG